MIYTVASTLPDVHGGRTKSLLNRIKLYNEELKVEQTILTTNYNPNYIDTIKLFQNKGIIVPNQKIVNLYDWLSGFKLFKNKKNFF